MVSLVIRPLISLPRIAPFTESTDISLPSEEAQWLPQGRPLVRSLVLAVLLADDQLAQHMALQVPWILGESGAIDLQFCLSGPGLGVLA